MGDKHDHSHHHHHHHHALPTGSSQTILWGFLLNTSFTLIELAGGIWTGSVAILADAIHDLGDSIALGLAWGLERYSRKNRDQDYSFGYRRFSLLSALISGIVIFSGAILILRESIPRLFHPGEPHSTGMVGLAILGLVFNGAAALKLGTGRSQNERMLSWHFWEDTLGWFATLITGLLIHFYQWNWADPVLALLLSLFIMRNVYRELRFTLRLFLQGTPRNFEHEAFRTNIRKIPGVVDIHDIHVWSLDGENHVLSLHAVLTQNGPENPIRVKKAIQEVARTHGIRHLTVETEFVGEECVDNCDLPKLK